MMPYDEAITYMQREAQDWTASGLAFLELMYNVGYMQILTQFGRQVTEITAVTDMVVGQRGYQMPPDCLWPKTIELVDGTTITPLFEVASDKTWASMKSGNMQGSPSHFHYRPRFGVGGGVLETNPISSSADYDLRMTYEANDKELSKTVYNAGTVTIEQGSADVVGTGTTFTADMVGRYLKVTADGKDRLWYRVKTFTDTTHLTLENVYQGNAAATDTYKISEMPNLPPDMHILPSYFSLMHWWSTKKNADKLKQFEKWFTVGMARAKKTHSVVVRDNIINQGQQGGPFPEYPPHFPLSLVS